MAQWTEMSPWLGKSARYEIQQLLLKSGIYCTANMWNRTVTPWQYEACKKKILVISNDVGNSGLSVVCGGYIVVDLDVVDSKPHGKWHRVTVRWHNHMEQLVGIVTWEGGHTWYLSFFLHGQNFWRIKFSPKKRVNYDKIHSKLPFFCVITAKFTVNCQFFTLNL